MRVEEEEEEEEVLAVWQARRERLAWTGGRQEADKAKARVGYETPRPLGQGDRDGRVHRRSRSWLVQIPISRLDPSALGVTACTVHPGLDSSSPFARFEGIPGPSTRHTIL